MLAAAEEVAEVAGEVELADRDTGTGSRPMR